MNENEYNKFKSIRETIKNHQNFYLSTKLKLNNDNKIKREENIKDIKKKFWKQKFKIKKNILEDYRKGRNKYELEKLVLINKKRKLNFYGQKVSFMNINLDNYNNISKINKSFDEKRIFLDKSKDQKNIRKNLGNEYLYYCKKKKSKLNKSVDLNLQKSKKELIKKINYLPNSKLNKDQINLIKLKEMKKLIKNNQFQLYKENVKNIDLNLNKEDFLLKSIKNKINILNKKI